MRIEDIEYALPTTPIDATNFDIQKWREENPMDYLKAMYFINNSHNKNESFKAIYQITRLYIPDILYKYYSLTENAFFNEQKLNTLIQKKIYMSEISCLNDPFDNKAFFYQPAELMNYALLKPHNGKLIDDFSSFNRVTCMTSNKITSLPMWAHYSNNHAGFCVSYDMKYNRILSDCTFPVQYTEERIDITSTMKQQTEYIMNEIASNPNKDMLEIIHNDLSLVYLCAFFSNIKHSSWSYENEFRCTMGANAKGMPYIDATPKEIYIGMNCSQNNQDKLISIANTLQIPIYQMQFDELDTNFNLSYKRI